MSVEGDGLQLFDAVVDGDFSAAKAALDAGLSANGPPGHPLPPIVAAAVGDHAGIVNLLLEQGADPNRSVTEETSCPCPDIAIIAKVTLGERALHIAARGGRVGIVRLLLERTPRADPNAADDSGRTPLMATCSSPNVCVEVVRFLLEAGADPALAQEDGCIPLHRVAYHGHAELFDMLYSRAPSTLDHCTLLGMTPLYSACNGGHENMVSKMLSLGATQLPPDGCGLFPLARATQNGFVSIVRILINDRRLRRTIEGHAALANALLVAVCARQVVVLRLLLTVQGEGMRSRWANVDVGGRRLLHSGAGFCHPAAVSILLEAGADEATGDSEGRTPLDVIGFELDRKHMPQMNRGEDVAIRRMLQRGPAYRARSWAWPTDEQVRAGVSGDGDTAAVAVPSSRLVVKTPPNRGFGIFRPKGNNLVFVRLVGR